jgi:hypothetical protein
MERKRPIRSKKIIKPLQASKRREKLGQAGNKKKQWSGLIFLKSFTEIQADYYNNNQ